MHEALERIYQDHRQGLYTLALAITRRPEGAEDAVHEAFARLCSRPARPDGDLVPYVYAAVRNAAIDQVRRARRRPMERPASIYDGPPDPSEQVLAEETYRALRRAVEALDPADREVVVMRIYGGLGFRQIAEVLGRPLQTVASRYRRALARIARRVRPQVETSHERA